MFEKEKELWVRFACAALSCLEDLYSAKRHEDIKAECDSAADYADEMCRLFHEKFENCSPWEESLSSGMQ